MFVLTKVKVKPFEPKQEIIVQKSYLFNNVEYLASSVCGCCILPVEMDLGSSVA
jgi:hypothetical protein